MQKTKGMSEVQAALPPYKVLPKHVNAEKGRKNLKLHSFIWKQEKYPRLKDFFVLETSVIFNQYFRVEKKSCWNVKNALI